MSKKQKTIDLGRIQAGKYGKFISLDKSVTSVQITRQYQVDGETVTQVVTVGKNEKGYLNPINIELPQSRADFRLEKGWIDESQAQKIVENAEQYGTSSFLTVKVES